MLGLGVFSKQVAADLRDNPVVVEHLGKIEDLDLDFVATLAVPGENEFVFDARGTKGDGVLTVTSLTVDDEREEVVAGTLQLESGDEIDLFPGRHERLEALP
ncbi:MAG: cytochrome c oxidase assembly factor 1 family protein [Thermoanaerobaculia bacterium]|nr:cytochrome c oxidase assembly factor 1 family protein [Thermoanaerobaculia bacterium]